MPDTPQSPDQSWTIVYFSGTGGTEYCALRAAEEFRSAGVDVTLRSLGPSLAGGIEEAAPELPREGHLLLLYPVHAADAPEPVSRWLNSLPRAGGEGSRGAVFSVSGGGSIWPNNDSRRRSLRTLRKKGYTLAGDEMLIMPTNWTLATPDEVIPLLFRATENRIRRLVAALRAGEHFSPGPGSGSALVSWVASLEHRGGRKFGRSIQVGRECSRCGWCARHCPAGNITLDDQGRPVFGSRCVVCMRCLYGCPEEALRPGFLKFFRIPQGFTLIRYPDRMNWLAAEDVVPRGRALKAFLREKAPGVLWLGLRRYLEEELGSSS